MQVPEILPAYRQGTPMNYERLYEYRFRDIDQTARAAVWSAIAPHVHGLMGSPQARARPGRRPRRVHRLDRRRRALGGRRGRLSGGEAARRASPSSPRRSWTPSFPASTSTGSSSPTSSSISPTRRPSPASSRRCSASAPRRADRDHGAELPLHRRRVLGLRRPLRRPHRRRRSPSTSTPPASSSSRVVPRFLPYCFSGILPSVAAARPASTCAYPPPGGCSASSSW